MKILAIRFARLGDVILLLPALGLIKASFPEAHIALLTGHRCAPIAELCPWIDEVIAVDRIAMRDGSKLAALNEMRKMVQSIRSRRFDAVIDFHSFRETNILSWLSRAPMRLGMQRSDRPFMPNCFTLPAVREDKSLHVSEMFERVAQGFPGMPKHSAPLSPWLRIPDRMDRWLKQTLNPGPRLALYVDAPVPDRIWPASRFAALAHHAVQKLNASVVILAGPGGAAAAEKEIGSERSDRIQVLADLTLPQLAAVIGSARVLISNDTGPMHLGPALNIPTLGLFSVGLPEHFRPIGSGDRFIRKRSISEIGFTDVVRTLEEMWAIAADRDSRR